MSDYRPGPLTALQYLRNVTFYVHAAIATLLIGVFGIVSLRDGRRGANRVADRWIAHLVWAARLHLNLRCEVRGTPPTHDVVVAAKHQCFWDILMIAHAVPRRAFIMKREVMRVPVVGWFAWKVGCIPIDRRKGKDAMSAISTQINQRIAGDGLGQLIIYPEGTRTLPGERRPYKHGVATIRASSGLPVIPVAVNTGLFWPRSGWGIRPGTAIIEFLPAIDPDLPRGGFLPRLEAEIETASDRLMAEAGFTPIADQRSS
ncbi:1-acyl-sn-glycerol-3-phosphate acyltransferase [Paracoccus sp. 1_MG-2023]|uniref:lysophospholipid acyltransferase family protein n=1 Tax=unclassified Paracoccus (in: a-proteobacteria) TaxID=2688777 RepID=UPI001C083A83|nr:MULTISPECIES: 1-acyl-sn-glycerol-3-phosphate acyltransferase [unclassified Paracoccus (in: a-proteobacteria)]MBU2957013.1 1-acyl-sn-glycerol-3-phosphate acyltransferase [Paracoccus sp. C2R09]MDO6668210.1 1-acyl-sn-glycerol-3-phosphate acyltransferase [Paracoccus sp. 1_MG-2023]